MGSIKRLIIEKVSGRIAYVVISFGETSDSAHALPWGKLNYDHNLGGYRTDITEIQLQKAPAFARQEDHDWSDLRGRDELDAHYDIPPHMRAI